MIKLPTNLPKEITDKYDIIGNSFVIKDKGDISEEFEIEIGDVLQEDFKPALKLKRWTNECNMSVRLIDNEPDKPQIITEGNKIKFIKNKIECHFYEIEKGYEFEVLLKEKPKTNKIEMSIETKGLKFYYQPELTQQEIDNEAFRPENVIGSYAVYHESKQGDYSPMGLKNYRAGKAFHIYRPRIIDNAGTEVWGKLNITDDLLTVEIPQEFLDNAVYPVRHASGLRFGYDTEGDTYAAWTNLSKPCATKGSPAQNGSATSISCYVESYVNMEECAALFSDNAGAVGNLLAQSATQATATQTGWRNIDITYSSLVASTNYWVAWNSSDYNGIYYDTASPVSKKWNSELNPIDDWGNSPATISTNTEKLSIYCTYTAGGSDLTPSVSDQLNLTENISITNTALGGISKSDQLNLTEDISITIFFPDLAISVSDQLNLTEYTTTEIEAVSALSINVSDAITITENVSTANTQSNINIFDSLTLTESITSANAQLGGINISDQLNLTENIGVSVGAVSSLAVSVSDDLTISENIVFEISSFINVNDNINLTESITLTNTQLGNISTSDTLTVSENITAENIQSSISIFDSLTITEDKTVNTSQATVDINVSDTVSIVDIPEYYPDELAIKESITVEITADVDINVNDNISITEDITSENTQLGEINVNSQINLTEDASVQISLLVISVSDSLSLSENIVSTKVLTINVSDQLDITESTTIENENLGGVNVSSDISTTELVAIGRHLFISISDAINTSESTVVENAQLAISVNDQLNITESAVVDISVIVLAISISDDIILTEDVSSANTQLGSVSVFDQLNLTEDTTLANTQLGSINVSDQLNLTESAVVQYSVTSIDVSVNDALTISENVVLTNTQLGEISLSDQLNLTENVVAETSSSSINVSDTLTISENIGKIATIKISILDEITIAELISSSVILPTPFKPTLRIETMKPIIEIKSTGSILTIKTIKPIMKII